ncbi:Integral membrane protein [Trichoderma simmonsii]|uniref:Integral membrane protein n=1 Tax=Trichoderma simmonsii TaxID=1491479 RepID=A0A8G0LG67_9HYPO|nr:Integral membrane protein [Trichoderma simmonsii]
MSSSPPEELPIDRPPAINYVLSFILVGLAWGLTTPFIRRAARTHKPAPHPLLDSPAVKQSWLRSRLYAAFFSVLDLLRNPRYAVPLVLNLTGSVWFFLLIGKAGESLQKTHAPCMSHLEPPKKASGLSQISLWASPPLIPIPFHA